MLKWHVILKYGGNIAFWQLQFFHSFGHNYVPSVTWIHRMFYSPSKCFFPNNLLFISAICVYHPAALFFSSLYYDLFLQSTDIFLPSCKRCLPELMADSAAQSVFPRRLIIQFGSKTHSGTFTTVVGHQLILLWLQSKVLYVVWDIFTAVFGSRQFLVTCLIAWRTDFCWVSVNAGFRKRP